MAETTLEQAPKQVQDLFNKGFTAFERGNLNYAIDLLLACLDLAPGLLQARKFLRAAEIRRLKGKKQSSMSHLVSTVQGLPTLLRGQATLKTKDPLQSVSTAERLLRKDPLNMKFIRFFVEAALNADLPEAAVQTLEVARDHYPEDLTIINWLGEMYVKMGRMRSARECFERLCELSPNDPRALKSLKDAMALDSMSTDGWSKTAETGGTFREIIKDTKEAHLLEQEGKAVKTDSDADALIAELREKIEREPGNVNYYRGIARLYAQKHQFSEAVNAIKKALALSPGDPELDNLLSSIRGQDYDYRVEQLRGAGNGEAADKLAAEKAQFLFDDLQSRLERYPNDLGLRFDWGVALFENGYVNESIQQFQLSQRSPKHRIRSLFYLARCFKQKEQYDIAREQLERAASELYAMDATKKDVLYELGDVCEAMGDTAKAAEYFKEIYQADIGYKDIADKVERVYRK